MDKAEFEARVLACERKLYIIAYQILRANADCEDAVQETLMRAWLKRDALKTPQYFETWLIRILVNESRRIYAKRASRAECAPLENLPAPEAANGAVYAAINALAPKHRLPLILKYAHGYKISEISFMLGVPATTVAFRLRRARKLIKEEFT